MAVVVRYGKVRRGLSRRGKAVKVRLGPVGMGTAVQDEQQWQDDII